MNDGRTAGQLSALRAAFDDAALSPNRWVNALRLLAEACGAPHGQLIGVGGPAAVMFNWISNGSERLNALRFDPAFHDPASNFRIIAGMRAAECEVVGEERYGDIIAGLDSLSYVRIAEKHGIRHGLQTNLSTGNGQIVGLATLGPTPTDEEQRAAFAVAVPFAQTAVRIQAALDHQGTQLVAGTLEAMQRAAFVIDGGGMVQAMTPEADRLLSLGAPFRINRQMLKATNPEDDALLQDVLATALSAQEPVSAHHALLLGGAASNGPHIADIVVMPAREWAMHFRPRVIVTVRDSNIRQDPTALLRAAFGLTPAEAEVARHLVSGLSRSTIAEDRGTSEHTIHAHLKSIFSKTGVNREIELAARLRDFFARP